jgi:hypothetical protein
MSCKCVTGKRHQCSRNHTEGEPYCWQHLSCKKNIYNIDDKLKNNFSDIEDFFEYYEQYFEIYLYESIEQLIIEFKHSLTDDDFLEGLTDSFANYSKVIDFCESFDEIKTNYDDFILDRKNDNFSIMIFYLFKLVNATDINLSEYSDEDKYDSIGKIYSHFNDFYLNYNKYKKNFIE